MGLSGIAVVAQSDDGALADSVASREIFLRKTHEPATKLDMRMLVTPLSASLHDASALDGAEPGKNRQAAISLREQKSYGLLLPSRTRSGESIAVALRPTAFAGPAVQTDHYSYIWDGQRISQIYCYSDGRTIDPDELITVKKRRAA
ncbi:MAG: RES family NAD+ phosphorylase [Hyphomicrobium sp.]|nr:RES family NAD+ phosphorylase [Hyphomicrobium sp.]